MTRLPGLAALLLAGWTALGARATRAGEGAIVLQMWHSQKRQNEQALRDVADRFHRAHPAYEVRLHNLGSYTTLFRKAHVTVRGGQLPDLCVCYPSMVVEFMEAKAVLPLDDYFNHPDYGLTKEEQADIFPNFLQGNRYAAFDNQLLSFPFTKSLLMLYYNEAILKAAGHDGPPATWSEFVQQCRDVKAKTGKTPFAYSRDPSSFDSMVMSLGGALVSADRTRSLLGGPEAVRVLQMLRTLKQEGLAKVIPIRSDDDRTYFSHGSAAFILRTSTTRAYMRKDIVDEEGRDRFAWGMACPPVGAGQPKRTVLYGGNICVFRSTPERQRGAWEFIKFFISPAVTAEWSARTGYLPVRRSAATQKALADFFAKHPRNRATFETIPHGVFEPSLAGWQGVRDHILVAVDHVLEGGSPDEAAAELARRADAELGGPPVVPKGWGAVPWIALGVAVLLLLLFVVRRKPE